MKFVKCIENSKVGFPSIKEKIYKVLKEDRGHYYCHNLTTNGEIKERFVEVELNEKITKILYG